LNKRTAFLNQYHAIVTLSPFLSRRAIQEKKWEKEDSEKTEELLKVKTFKNVVFLSSRLYLIYLLIFVV
jgi:hypothetical protein